MGKSAMRELVGARPPVDEVLFRFVLAASGLPLLARDRIPDRLPALESA
jgi:hypothetical protein